MSTVKQPGRSRGARLTVANLAVEAGGSRLLSGIDLEIGPGEIVTLAGPSGSGKTVLLRSICGLQDPAEGEVRLGGSSPDEIGWPAFRRQVVFLPQRPVLHDTTVEENLARPFAFRAARGSFSPPTARDLLSRLGLPPDTLAHAARDLSEGQQQRVALARALLVGPPFLLLDEPTSALDPDSREAVEALLQEEVSAQDRGLLVVTHDPAQAERLGHLRLRLEAQEGSPPGRRDFILTGGFRRAPPGGNEPGPAGTVGDPGRPEPGAGA